MLSAEALNTALTAHKDETLTPVTIRALTEEIMQQAGGEGAK